MNQDKKDVSRDVSRRDAMKTALLASAYAAPAILSASVPATASAQVSSPYGTLTGTITSSASGLPIAGAIVAIGPFTTVTNSSGVYTLSMAPSGSRPVVISATNFTTRTDTVVIAGATTYSTALVPVSASGAITIVLTWGATPPDLDAHLTGPIDGSSSRFHTYWDNPISVPYATLDVDDTNGFGPETITVSPVAGAPDGTAVALGRFVAGEYRYFVHNYETTPEFNASAVTVAVFQGGVQLASYLASAATGSPTLDYWLVFNFTLTATASGQIAITPVQQYAAAGQSDAPVSVRRKR